MRPIQHSLILILLFAFSACHNKEKSNSSLDLSGDWQFKKQGDSIWLSAIVPGTVQTDLYANHLISDPFYGDNEQRNKWIENENWMYRKDFFLDLSKLKQNAELIFEGLDTYATVFLNGKQIIESDNMFRSYKIEIDSFLLEGKNRLEILFESPVQKALPFYDTLPYRLPADNDRNDKQTSVFTRKAPYQYGWDWGPRYVTMGIWRPVKIQFWDDFNIIENRLYQIELTDEKALVAWIAEVYSDTETSLFCSVQLGKEVKIDRKFDLVKGINHLADTFNIEHPKRWWPNGYGRPELYVFDIQLKTKNRDFSEKKRMGFRTIKLITEKDSIGESFYFKVNGIPIYAKGANYIPQDNFLPNVDSSRYVQIIKSVKASNMNMLRVWGGGIYENDLFYDLCDENGILLWQDFMFACSLYPGDSAFIHNVKAEAIDNIKRLRDHPSLALWCGNNEINELWFNWGYQKKYSYSNKDSLNIWDDYQNLFNRLLPDLVKEWSPQIDFWESSPKIGWGHAESMSEGDSHYWGIWWGKEPFEVYAKKVPRFASEFGFQSFPQRSTLLAFADSNQMHIDSKPMHAHQKSSIGNQTIVEYMARDFPVPTDFEDFVYVSQLVQAYGLSIALEAQRRAKPYCMGSLYWQLNDCWPGISWSGLDYFGNWKALHYEAQHDFATFLISMDENSVYIVSDSLADIDANLELKLMDFNGQLLFSKNSELHLSANRSALIYTIPDEIINQFASNQVLMNAKLYVGEKLRAQNVFYFVSPKELRLSSDVKPEFKLKNGKLFVWSQNGKLIKNLYLQTNTNLSANYFDL
ncbi:MAG: glycoside hydrolase family 2 protein, partial [Bacteroidales bacterium]|nr:glycoside hydrolase family 2 protein [Bacteroidales bacterium]